MLNTVGSLLYMAMTYEAVQYTGLYLGGSVVQEGERMRNDGGCM